MRALVHFYKSGFGRDPGRDMTFSAVLHLLDCRNRRFALSPYGETEDGYWRFYDSIREALAAAREHTRQRGLGMDAIIDEPVCCP